MLTYFLNRNRKILITVLLAIVSASGGRCIVSDNFAAAAENEWKAWKVNAETDVAARDALSLSLTAPDDTDNWRDGNGYYAFQTELNKGYDTVFPFYDGGELTIYDGLGNPYDFVGLTFAGEIESGFLKGLYISDGENTFVYDVNGQPDIIDGRFYATNFIEYQANSLKNIFTNAEEKSISFTLLIKSDDVDSLSVEGFFELSPNSMEASHTPEPGTLLIFGAGISGLALANARRRKK